MGPKKKDALGENQWRKIIEDAQLNGDNFKVKVILMECAGNEQDRIYLNRFESFATVERRFVVKNICKSETIFMINQLGGEKKVKDDGLRVFEEGQAYLKDKKDIPHDIQALIIKHLIIKMKEEYLFIKRQKLEVKEGIRRESATMINNSEVRGTVNVSPQEPPPPPARGKGRKGDSEPLSEPAEGKKYNTSLRVRGEEWRDRVYVDDFPTDGPNLYVAVTGFGEQLLPISLIKIGIPLTSVVQIRIDATATKVPSTLFRATKRGQSQTEILMEKSLKFWEDLQQLRIHRDFADYFKNTAFIIFRPPYWESDSLSGDPSKIYDELCYLMYDIQDLSRQHVHYLDNMDCIHIPEETEEDRYLQYYHQQIDELPLECVTIYSVLDGILQTVSKCCEFSGNHSRSSLSTAITLNQQEHLMKSNVDNKIDVAENIVKEVFNSLCKTEEDQKSYRLTYGEEYEELKAPTVIQYGDFSKYSTFHLGNINLDNIIASTLYGMPINRLWQNQNRPEGELEAKINFHVNVLLSCFDREDVETAELDRLMHILACRKLYNNRSSLKKQHLPPSTVAEFKKVYLKRSVLSEPLSKCPSRFQSCSLTSPSFPSITKTENISDMSACSGGTDSEVSRIKFLFDCPDISELVSAAEIANNKPINHMIDDFEIVEDFTGVVAFQIMLDAYNNFNCLDYKYCEVTDCMVIMFFNSHDKDGVSHEEWRCHLQTPLCLQDYFDYILDEQYSWIQNEERMYDEKMVVKSQSECQVSIDPFAMTTCLENTEVDLELLMEGSLKYQEIEQMEDPSPVTSQKTLTKKSMSSPMSTVMDSKSSRKMKSPTASTPKNKQQINLAAGGTSDNFMKIRKKPFFGYDLGDRRVEVFGKDSTYFSRDGSRVSSKYILIIPMNLEYIILNPVPGNGVNEFWIHKALGEFVTAEDLEKCESFRIVSKDQVMLNVRKRSYYGPAPETTQSNYDNTKQKQTTTKTQPQSNMSPIMPAQVEMCFYSLYVTWPNGLVTETVHEGHGSDISHVKQHYVTPNLNLDENKRCVSLNGEVIIFKKTGDIEVLRPDGTYINITKYERKNIAPETDVHSETSSNKSKKGKVKDKHSRTSSKSSKQAMSEDLNEMEQNLPAYKLFIDEFEIVETNGLKQKWIKDIPFDIEKLLIRTATDYCLGEVFSRRMDGTNIFINRYGIQIVTFPNNTRIITEYIIEDFEIYPEWTEEERAYFEQSDSDVIETDTAKGSISQRSYINTSKASAMSNKIEEEELKEKERTDGFVSVQVIYTVEHPNLTTLTINQANGNVSVGSPNNTTVVVDAYNNYEIALDNVTTAIFNGKQLHINYVACPKCKSCTTWDVSIARNETSSTMTLQQNWLKMKDSFCKKIVVNDEGNIIILDEPCSQETFQPEERYHSDKNFENADDKRDRKSESSVTSHSKCRVMYQAKSVRFFALRRDLSCSEIVHRALVEQYKRACRWQPWCSVARHDTFGDRRTAESVVAPVRRTETEKWLMDSKLADKPTYLTYKDLKKDCGKGFYHWMRPHGRFEPRPTKPDNVLPPRLPRAFITRILEEQWCESEREELKGGKELLTAILRYRVAMAEDCAALLHVPVVDFRSERERRTDHAVQALGHRIYMDLQSRLERDVEGRAKASISARPPLVPAPLDPSVEPEGGEEAEEMPPGAEECASAEQELDRIVPPSAALRRYWRRRAEEQREEEFYTELLREGSVPPYFRNVLGGAIWWRVNAAADDAVRNAERRGGCQCAAGAPKAE